MEESMNILKAKDLFTAEDFPIEIRKQVHNGHTKIHMHDFYEFVFLETGISLHTYADKFTVLLPGDMFGIRPMEPHEYTRAKQAVLYNILFDIPALGDDYEEIRRLPGLKEIFEEKDSFEWRTIHLPLNKQISAVKIIKSAMEQQKAKDAGWKLAVKSCLVELLVLYAQSYKEMSYTPTDEPGGQVSYIYEALAFIEKYYQNPINVNQVARHCGISADYLTKCFKKFTGLTPIDYMKHYKLAKSVELIKDPKISIAQAASETGFDDHTYFSRLFKQVFGMSPSEFRKHSFPE
jgi:AraC family L-rhamnose operon regulatory protein RhaS